MVYNDVNDFLMHNAWWLALIAAGLILIVVAIIVLTGIKRKKKEPSKKKINYKNVEEVKSSYFDALGGEGNVLEKSIVGSRIKIRLSDYSLLDKEKIKEAGVDGIIQMSDMLYLVVKDDASKVYKILFGE